MVHIRRALPAAVLASLLVGKAGAEQPTQLLPTSDVDIIYEVTLPSQPRIRERVRYLAAEQLERVDGPHKSTTIFDRRTHEITSSRRQTVPFSSWICRGSRKSPGQRPRSSAATNQSL